MDYRYWDSNCFLKWLKKEPDYERCKGVLLGAVDGSIKILTSALTIAEVIYIRTGDKITREQAEDIRSMFEEDYIQIVNVDRTVAITARELMWSYGQKSLRPNDALHVASAIRGAQLARAKSIFLDTFDMDLLKLNGIIINDPPLIIGIPNIVYQEKMFEEGTEEGTEEIEA